MPVLTLSLLGACIYGSAAGSIGAQEYYENIAGFESVPVRAWYAILDGVFWPATLASNANLALQRSRRRDSHRVLGTVNIVSSQKTTTPAPAPAQDEPQSQRVSVSVSLEENEQHDQIVVLPSL